MKKYVFLTSVLALAACGGGHGGGVPASSDGVPVISVPQQRISADVVENRGITNMVSSVNNSGEMTMAVENAIGTELLTDISGNLSGIADSIRNYSNRELSDRRTATVGLSSVSGGSKTQAAYAFLEYGRRFRNLDRNNQSNFMQQHPEHRNFIMGWGKLFCDCDVNSFSDNQLLDLFDNVANKNRFDNFYKEHSYKEFLLDDVRFNVSGFSNGEVDNEYIKFDVNTANGVITGLSRVDDEDEIIETMYREKDANGNYLDTFRTVGYKYQISVPGWQYPYATDSFSDMNISPSDLRAKIANILNHEEDCDESCRNTILAAFDNGNGRWIEQKSQISYDLRGNGLRYSDFGYMTMVTDEFDGEIVPEDERDPDHTVIVGGFKDKQIDPSLFADETIDFRGTAIGAVAYYNGTDEESKRISTNEQNPATLHFENGNETLIMPFNDYYTVTVNKDENGATVAFSDYPTTANPGFKFNKESDISTDNGDLVNVVINYYGDNYVPSEVAGGVSYEEHASGLTSFESAFGMTRQ